MIDFVKWAFQKNGRSRDTARQRLQLILVMDRIGLAPDCMEALKRDIIQVVSKYLVVDEDSIEMDMKRSDESLVLVSNIQVKNLVRATSP